MDARAKGPSSTYLGSSCKSIPAPCLPPAGSALLSGERSFLCLCSTGERGGGVGSELFIVVGSGKEGESRRFLGRLSCGLGSGCVALRPLLSGQDGEVAPGHGV